MLQHLKTYVRIIDAGGITRAAEQLSLTQPAVTKQLHQLERAFEAELVWRQHRRIRMTPAGELVYHYARRVLALVEEARQAVREQAQPGRGEIVVGAVSTVALFTLPPVLEAFLERFPLVRVRVKIGEIQDNLDGLLRGDLALAIMTVPVVHPEVVSIPLFSDPVRLVAAPLRAAGLPQPLELKDLAKLDFISYATPSRFRTLVDGVLEQHGIIPHVVMEFNDHEAVKGMAKAGLGVAMVPDSVVREDIARGDLVALAVQGLPPIERATSLAFAREHPRTRIFQALAGAIVRHFGVPEEQWRGWLAPEDAAQPARPRRS